MFKKRRSLAWNMNKWSYLFIVPGVVLLFVFSYIPMFGLIIVFKDYDVVDGFFGSPFNGFENFRFLQDDYFWNTVKNTLLITVYRMLVTFPLPIIVAIMLNELRSTRKRRVIQSLIYLPHFVSWIVVAYIITSLLALDTGIVNNLLQSLGFDQVYFMGEPKYFRTIVVLSSVWKGTGWGTIMYLAVQCRSSTS